MKITVDLEADLYRALKVEAARADRSLRDVIGEALKAWLERAEDEEDRASAEDALTEYRRDGGVAAAEFFERLAAETRAVYGSSEPPDRA
jgi:Arc/MetJ-type ribon-helix-helix transcriptional regulator